MDDGSESDHLDTLIIEGTVTDTNGNIIENAKVEVWHANGLGNYSFFDKSQSDLTYAVLFSVMPMVNMWRKRPCHRLWLPTRRHDSSFIKQTRSSWQPSISRALLHFCTSYRKLTTQFNIEGDQYLWDDFAFATREGLVATAVDVTDAAEIQRRGLDKPFKHITFNFELVKDTANAPSTEVERRRASA